MICFWMPLWPQNEIDELMRLWNNYSASQIGAMLGRTRNAIIGKVNRLVSTKQIERSNSHKIYLERRARMPRSSPPKPEVKNVEQPPPQPLPIVFRPARPCTIYGLTYKRCHFPLGEFLDRAVWYCGNEVVNGRPYCRHHCEIAYYGFHCPGQAPTGREA